MSTPTFRILIAGGGIAGPCLAFWLTKTSLDISIVVIERSPFPRSTGQAIDIRGPAVKIIQQMGLEETIKSKHTGETGTAFVDSDGKIIAQFESTGDTSRQSATSEFEILRAELADVFLKATEGKSNIKYVYGDSIKGLEQDGADVWVTFDKRKQERFDVVVAGDGQGSKTRSFMFDKETLADPYNFLGQYAAFFTIPSRANDAKTWRIHAEPKGRSISLRPHRHEGSCGAYLVVTQPARGNRDPAIEEAMKEGPNAIKKILHEYFKDAGWEVKRVLEGMDQSDDFYFDQVAQVKLPKWTNGRCVLIGDAGFAPTPISGQGTSLAIESAYVLAGELSKVRSSVDIPTALENYEKVLRPLVDKVQNIPSAAPQIANPQTNWGIWALNTAIWGVQKSGLYKLFGSFGEISEKDWKMPEYKWAKP
jgi:2-polyprenyl-6-methoxyphenol hydroxylase-like FAD-dependent oxidoreductase